MTIHVRRRPRGVSPSHTNPEEGTRVFEWCSPIAFPHQGRKSNPEWGHYPHPFSLPQQQSREPMNFFCPPPLFLSRSRALCPQPALPDLSDHASTAVNLQTQGPLLLSPFFLRYGEARLVAPSLPWFDFSEVKERRSHPTHHPHFFLLDKCGRGSPPHLPASGLIPICLYNGLSYPPSLSAE